MDISWSWSLGNVPLGSFIAWSFPPPDYDCAVIYPRGWIDTPCSARFPVVCFDETKTGNGRYIFVPATMVWLDAQKYCRQHYTDLASSRDATENSVIMNLVPDWTWFGLFRNSWKWIDKTVFSTWKSGNPNNALKDKNCGYLNNSLADNGLCTNIMPFICYVEPQLKKQQTIKIKIQSNQDPHDPALKVAILEQIEQKLKNQGLFKNITVKFREQPDGKFFYMIN
ncbi:putative C-type lectin domain family 20 member A [Silurus meridionalis]|uniref:putative C-type lectin domain family 20 member A n=1 Tax=Silurus meridionalis TaxID=175797 RepID=UPI001EE9B7AD|nr:putative C-type lectin domain family 20 member A [Silurus meridionalis]